MRICDQHSRIYRARQWERSRRKKRSAIQWCEEEHSAMSQKIYDIIVLGGGPAGMMAAARAGELGARVLIVEKNDRLGKKLSITGGRRCNITNAVYDNRLFLDNFPETKQFLFSPFSQFNVESTFSYFESRGLPLVIEERNRAFPKSQKAADVCAVLKKDVAKSGNVTLALNAAVQGFLLENKTIVGVKTSAGAFRAPRIILATGGYAAPETGSTGEVLRMLKALGHTVKPPNPNLSPLRTSAKWVHELSGTSLDDVKLRFISHKKTAFTVRGRLLFTHFGISGPMVINASHRATLLLKKGKVIVSVDMFPDENIRELDARLLSIFEDGKNKLLKTILKELLQKKFSETILQFPNMQIGNIPAHSITKEQRKMLIHTLKDLHFPITGTMGLDWAIVADGGVAPVEVDFKTMTSRRYPNVYIIGDALDINRPSGGFSLQLCWTTGFVAGSHAAHVG
jgi:predicted Rossmann fold flavoprotein